ncbi:MAG: dedicator of cytokinesis-domain-containing protein [Olpidium bornovanus]|uniref:Dedicator of cytokinesis-domain-containing protein n=1 Tax=Olpidium bornovanus TaxID=278681 RepID=A0A8H7ZTS5_9FUNG|nr:MAG: dedicator of cytokinesis-domain-containing protein [Olpidium bornovanus]
MAIQACKELINQYETKVFQYQKVADVSEQLATFYRSIMTKERYPREYFRVGYYGRAFPPSLRNRQFIYRGDEWEKIAAFCERIQNRHPTAVLLKSNSPPGDDILNSEGQYLQITAVAPEPDRTQEIFTKGDLIADPIRAYYEVNQVNKFSFSRPFRKASKSGNEFLDLWTEKTVLYSEDTFPSLLRRSEVIRSETNEISPVENALIAMNTKNKELRSLAKKYGAIAADIAVSGPSQKVNANPLTMSLNGAVDAPVNGGVPMYKQAFFDPKYVEHNPDKETLVRQLRDAINEQVRTRLCKEATPLEAMSCVLDGSQLFFSFVFACR